MKFAALFLMLIPLGACAQVTKMSSFSRQGGESDDTGRLRRAMTAAEKTGALDLDERATYSISETLDVTKVVVIRGLGKGLVKIEMTVRNKPVFRSLIALPYERHSYKWSGFTLSNRNAPTANSPLQYGIMFSSGEKYDGNGVYWSHFSDLRLHNQYIGMGNYSSGKGASAFWGNTIERVEATGIAYSGFWLGNAGVIGQPYNRFRDIAVLGQDVKQVPGAKAFHGLAVGGLILESLGVEDWSGTLINILGGGIVSIRNVTTERCTFGPKVRILDLMDGHFEVRNIEIEGVTKGDAYAIVSLYGKNCTGDISGITGPTRFRDIVNENGARVVNSGARQPR